MHVCNHKYLKKSFEIEDICTTCNKKKNNIYFLAIGEGFEQKMAEKKKNL